MDRRLRWGLLLVSCLVVLAPLLIADVPPVLDYPNHLARLVLLAAGPDDPVLGRIFVPQWRIVPDLAIDAIVPPLLHVLPVHVAGRLLLAGVLLLNLAGVLALHRALHGALFGCRAAWPLASALVAYNEGFLLGFLNWQIGCGLAMLAAAAWLRWRAARPAACVTGGTLAAIVLFFCHLMGVCFFLVLIAGAEWRAARGARDTMRRAVTLLPVALPPIVLFLMTDLRGAPLSLHWVSPLLKLAQAAGPFVNYVPLLDYGSAALVYGGLALAVACGWCRVAPAARPTLIGLALLYWALPFDLMSTSFLDTRVALMLGFLAFAATDWSGAPRRVGALVAGAAVLLLAVRLGVLGEIWLGQLRDVADLRAAIAPAPPGATVLFTNVSRNEAPDYWAAGPRHRWLSIGLRTEYHLPALLLIERGAYWQELFANPTQQPIALRPDYAELHRAGHALPPHSGLAAHPSGLARFDYMLLLEADAAPGNPAPTCLTELTRTGFAALFRTRPEPGC